MRISTTLNTIRPNEKFGGVSACKAVDLLFEAGFRCMDIPFFKYASDALRYDDTPFFSDGWKDWASSLKEHAAIKGVTFNQTHNLTFNFFTQNVQTRLLDKCVDRAIMVTSQVGAPCTVMHPIAPLGYEHNRKECLKMNSEYFKRKAELAGEQSVTLLLENMLSNRLFDGSVFRRYCDNADELIELVETVDMPNVKICFDVGHAHYMTGKECEDMRILSPYIKGVHIHDNDRFNDEHLAPYQGTIDWEALCRTFAQIGYSGDFTYEISNAVSRMPAELQKPALISALNTAEYLVSRVAFYSE